MWQESNSALTRSWSFADFSTAWAFASRCALVFEKHDHHPDMTVGWGKVTITTTTHDAGTTVTDKDRTLVAALDELKG